MADQETSIGETTGSVLLTHEVGLHARPSVKLTKLAKTFGSSIELGLGAEGPWIDAKSIVKVMAAKAPQGTTLHFRAVGADADQRLGGRKLAGEAHLEAGMPRLALHAMRAARAGLHAGPGAGLLRRCGLGRLRRTGGCEHRRAHQGRDADGGNNAFHGNLLGSLNTVEA